jgi:hypothetical protein
VVAATIAATAATTATMTKAAVKTNSRSATFVKLTCSTLTSRGRFCALKGVPWWAGGGVSFSTLSTG